jgi:valyl-tRNA synthetase
VDPEFGSGAVKITPAHDPNDFEMAARHGAGVAQRDDARRRRMNESAPEAFRGLDRFEARRAWCRRLRELGLLEKVEEHTHAVPHCYRCHTVVEPRLSDQWFVRMKPLAEPALAASRDGRVRFHPERFTRSLRALAGEHPRLVHLAAALVGAPHPRLVLPAEGCGETIVSRETPDGLPDCGGRGLEQDPDVLDTWFSSWLWPFSTLGWPEETADLRAFYPTTRWSPGRHPLLLGRPDDHGRARVPRRGAPSATCT